MDMVITVVDNGKLLKPQTLSDNNKVVPYFETIERDEKGNQFLDKKAEDWIYKMNGFESKEAYMESIQRVLVVHDKRTQYVPEEEPDTTLVTTTGTLQLWKESDGRGCQVYATLDKDMPIDQAFEIVVKTNDETKTYNVYNKGRTNLPSPIFKDGTAEYTVNGETKITAGGLEDYEEKYNFMLEEYYKEYEIQKCNLVVTTSKVYNAAGNSLEVYDLYRQNLKPMHFTFDEKNGNIILVSDNDVYELSIVDCIDIDGNTVPGYKNMNASIISEGTLVSNSYKYATPTGNAYQLKVAWKTEIQEYGLKFAKIKAVKDNETTYYYMIIDYNSENKFKSYATLEEAQSQLNITFVPQVIEAYRSDNSGTYYFKFNGEITRETMSNAKFIANGDEFKVDGWNISEDTISAGNHLFWDAYHDTQNVNITVIVPTLKVNGIAFESFNTTI